jgi:enterochelin esterase-like enzyme
MNPIRRNLSLGAAAFLSPFHPVRAQSSAVSGGNLVRLGPLTSGGLLPRKVDVWLPPGYDNASKRYPVIYMHDGQNLFEPGSAYAGKTWAVAEALVRMRQEAIVVGIWNTANRGLEYLPKRWMDFLTPAQRNLITKVHGKDDDDDPLSDPYLNFIVSDLKPLIDQRFRSRPQRESTSIMGSSMGGLISIYALGEYPSVFGQAAGLSVHWPLVRPEQTAALPPKDVADAFAAWLQLSSASPEQQRLYFDHGTANLDGYYRPYSQQIEARLAKLNWQENQHWVSRVYDGADHNEAAWSARIETPLRWLLGSAS